MHLLSSMDTHVKSEAHMRLQVGHGTADAFEACHRKPVWRRSRAAARR
jgi:hypothetical protein